MSIERSGRLVGAVARVPTLQICLIRDHKGWLSRQLAIIEPEFLLQAHQVFHGVSPFRSCRIYDEHQSPSPRNMPQKLVPKPTISVCPVDETRDVGHAKAGGILFCSGWSLQ